MVTSLIKKGRFFLQLIQRIIRHVLDLVYPATCHECKILIQSPEIICSECTKHVITPIATLSLTLSKEHSITVHALSVYQGSLKQLILKKNLGISYPFKGLASLTRARHKELFASIDTIIPVPTHWSRILWRGFNQANILAQHYAVETGKEYLNCIERTRSTDFQAALNKDARHQNVQHAFRVKKSWENNLETKIKGKHVVIIDDVMTTGATLREVARCIQRYKPKKITAIVVCRAV